MPQGTGAISISQAHLRVPLQIDGASEVILSDSTFRFERQILNLPTHSADTWTETSPSFVRILYAFLNPSGGNLTIDHCTFGNLTLSTTQPFFRATDMDRVVITRSTFSNITTGMESCYGACGRLTSFPVASGIALVVSARGIHLDSNLFSDLLQTARVIGNGGLLLPGYLVIILFIRFCEYVLSVYGSTAAQGPYPVVVENNTFYNINSWATGGGLTVESYQAGTFCTLMKDVTLRLNNFYNCISNEQGGGAYMVVGSSFNVMAASNLFESCFLERVIADVSQGVRGAC